MRVTLEKLNAIPDYFKGKQLTYLTYNTKEDPGEGIIGAVQMVDAGVVGIIGDALSPVSKTEQLVLKTHKIPQISPSSTSTEFSDKVTYPYFLRTIPEGGQVIGRALIDMILHFGWDQVATIGTNDDYGSPGIYNIYIYRRYRSIKYSIEMTSFVSHLISFTLLSSFVCSHYYY